MSDRKRTTILTALVLAALVALPAIAEEARAPRVAATTAAADSISWAPRGDFEKMILTVQGDGFSETRELTGNRPSFAPLDAEGNPLPDGTYNWELTAVPRALDANNKTYRSARPSADGRSLKEGTMPEPLVQSGVFTIANGSIVDPNLSEQASAAPRPTTRAAESGDIDDSDAGNQ